MPLCTKNRSTIKGNKEHIMRNFWNHGGNVVIGSIIALIISGFISEAIATWMMPGSFGTSLRLAVESKSIMTIGVATAITTLVLLIFKFILAYMAKQSEIALRINAAPTQANISDLLDFLSNKQLMVFGVVMPALLLQAALLYYVEPIGSVIYFAIVMCLSYALER